MLPNGNIVPCPQNDLHFDVRRTATLRRFRKTTDHAWTSPDGNTALFAWNHRSCLNLVGRKHCAVSVKSTIMLEPRRSATLHCVAYEKPLIVLDMNCVVQPAFHVIRLYSYWAFRIFLIIHSSHYNVTLCGINLIADRSCRILFLPSTHPFTRLSVLSSVRPSVRPSVRWSVRPSVRSSANSRLEATYAEL